jgi:hypothetical protein
LQGSPPGDGGYRRLFASFERLQHGIQIEIEGSMKFPVEIVEISALPNLSGFVTPVLQSETTHRIFNYQSTFSSIDLDSMGVWIGIGRIIRTNQTAISRITDPLPVVTSANCLQPDNENDNGWDQGLLFLNPYQVWLQPPGYVTQLFSNYYEPNLVASTVQSPGDVLDVTATKSADGKTLVLRVVNISGELIPATINLAGFSRSKPNVTGRKLSGPVDDENTAEQPDELGPVSVQWSLKPSVNQTSYRFDPYSVTILVFQ